jgi:tetratricopeptide (TPR) repeat protein
MLKLLPVSPERDTRELEIRQSTVQMLWVTRGYSAAETIEATEALAAVAEKGGNLRQLVNLMVSRSMNAYMLGDLHTSRMLDDRLLELAVRAGSTTSLAHAHYRQILSRIARADFAGAEQHFADWLRYFNDPGTQVLPGAGIIPLGFMCGSAWIVGRADLARERESQLIAAADRSNPYEVAFAAIFSANLRLLLREHHEQAAALAKRGLEISEESRFPFLTAYSLFFLGLARARLGDATQGVALIGRAIAGVLEIGATGNILRFSAGLAEAQALEGKLVEALATIDQVLEANPEQVLFRSEALSLQAELRVKLGEAGAAEPGFHEAIALAHKTGAKAWELRATMGLARLLDAQGRRAEARSMLAEIYNSFSEGFDTADLKDAQALFEQLNR